MLHHGAGIESTMLLSEWAVEGMHRGENGLWRACVMKRSITGEKHKVCERGNQPHNCKRSFLDSVPGKRQTVSGHLL